MKPKPSGRDRARTLRQLYRFLKHLDCPASVRIKSDRGDVAKFRWPGPRKNKATPAPVPAPAQGPPSLSCRTSPHHPADDRLLALLAEADGPLSTEDIVAALEPEDQFSESVLKYRLAYLSRPGGPVLHRRRQGYLLNDTST